LAYHMDATAADRLVQNLFRNAAGILPPGGMLHFDVIGTGEPPLTGRIWNSGVDWAVLADTREDPASRTLVREIESFRQVGDLYRRAHETHCVRLFNSEELADMLAGCGFAVEVTSAYGKQHLAPRRRAFLCTRL
jgi:hypothetical protein